MSASLMEMETPSTRESKPVVARLSGVSKNYGEVRALSHLDLTIHGGELLALLGPNGAGKTTAVKLLLGVMRPSVGTVRIFGGDPAEAHVRTRTGAMLQVARVPETLRVREHLALFRSYYPRPLRQEEVLAMTGLTDIADRLFGDLSGGQRQRVLFALAMCGDPDLLFLDEPTVGLDVESRRHLWEQIRALVERGKTVLLTTHYLEEADALADRIVVIDRGTAIAEGTPAEIKARTSGRRIRCTSRLSLETVRGIAGVVQARQERDSLEIEAREAEGVIRELLARDSSLSNLEVTSAGLEEAFLALTRENGPRTN